MYCDGSDGWWLVFGLSLTVFWRQQVITHVQPLLEHGEAILNCSETTCHVYYTGDPWSRKSWPIWVKWWGAARGVFQRGPNFHISPATMRHKLAIGMKASELFGMKHLSTDAFWSFKSDATQKHMCLGPAFAAVFRTCSSTNCPPATSKRYTLPTHDTKAWSIKWKLSPNKVQCIDKSSCFWMLSYSQIDSSFYSLCSKYCYVHYRHEAPNRSSCIHHPRANTDTAFHAT